MSGAEFPQPERKPKLVISFDEEPAPLVEAPPPVFSGSVAAGDVEAPQPVAATPAPTPAPAPSKGRLVITPDDPPPPPLPAVREGRGELYPQYTICTVAEVIDDRFTPEDSLVFPVPALERDSVIEEPRDGTAPSRVHCDGLQVVVGPEKEKLLRVSDIRARVSLTDCRLTVACSKFDKGGGWIGSPGLMLALNAGSKLLAAHRRRGKMLVGQIRYPWIRAVYAQNKAGWTGTEMLRVVVESMGEPMRLELTFPKDVDATAVATELIRRTATFRLTHETGLGPDERARLTELATIPPLVWQRGSDEMAGHAFPSHWPPGDHSAYMGLAV